MRIPLLGEGYAGTVEERRWQFNVILRHAFYCVREGLCDSTCEIGERIYPEWNDDDWEEASHPPHDCPVCRENKTPTALGRDWPWPSPPKTIH